METTLIQSTKNVLKKKVNTFEEQQKQRIINACKSSMKYSEVLSFIKNEIEQSEKDTTVNYHIRCWKSDGAFQFNKAVEEIFGSVKAKGDAQPSQGSGTIQTLDIILADGTRVKVPFGEIDLEELGEGAHITLDYDDDKHELILSGQCKYKYQSLFDDIADRTKELLKKESIYKNQALEITNINEDPKILDLKDIDSQMMVISKKTEFELRPLRSRILYPQECIKKGIPLKTGVLLEGSYGTGKTLLAFKTAREAVQNNWTFLYLKDPSALAETLRMIKVIDKSCNGVIVFVEDIDQVTKGDRDSALQDILNTLDGGDTKSMNVITLFTTNHIELINPTFLRGKRVGSIITMDCLDAETAEKFIRESFKESEGYVLDDDLSEVCNYIAEHNIAPAFMAEIVESTKSKLIFSDDNKVTSFHIRTSVDSYLRQVELSKKKDSSKTKEQELYNLFTQMVSDGVDKFLTV